MVAAQAISLGTFKFNELKFEVPENLEINKRTLGGSVEIPQAPGSPAQVATQTLGVIVEPIKIDAWFIGANALDNARKLEAIQLQQIAIPFVFGPLSYSVTVMAFGKKFRSMNEIGYSLDLTPQIETSVTNGGNGDGSAQSAASASLLSISSYPDPVT